jgi:hypothetical protein
MDFLTWNRAKRIPRVPITIVNIVNGLEEGLEQPCEKEAA